MAASCAVMVVAAVLYLRTAAPSVFTSDSAELQRVVYTLELPHPPGYPFYALLGHAWLKLVPVRDIARAVNLFSVAAAVAAVGIVAWTTARLADDIAAGAVAGLALATAPSFWSQAIVAEVYALHAFLVAAVSAALLVGRLRPAAVGLLVGLALAHHRMALLLLPGVALVLLARGREWSSTRRQATAGLVALALGLSPLVLTWVWGRWSSVSAFWRYVAHGGGAWLDTADIVGYATTTVWPLITQMLGGLGLATGGLGLALLLLKGRSRRSALGAALYLGVSWALFFVFVGLYRVPDIFAFLPHVQVLEAILVGLGACVLVNKLPKWVRLRWPRLGPAARGAAALSLALLLARQATGAWAVNQHPDAYWSYPRARSMKVLANVEAGALLIGDWYLGQTMRYLQAVEGVRPDLEIVIPPDKHAADAVARAASGRSVYVWGSSWADHFPFDGYMIIRAEHDLSYKGLYRVVAPHELDDEPAGDALALEGAVAAMPVTGVTVRPWPLRADSLAELTVCWAPGTTAFPDLPADRPAGERERGSLAEPAIGPGGMAQAVEAGGEPAWVAPAVEPPAGLGRAPRAAEPTTDFGGTVLVLEMDPERRWLDHGFDLPATTDRDGCTRHRLVLPPAPFAPAVRSVISVANPVDGSKRVVAAGTWPVSAERTAETADRVSYLPAPDQPVAVADAELVAAAHEAEVRPGIGLPVDTVWWLTGAMQGDAQLQLEDATGSVVSAAQVVLPSGFSKSIGGPPLLVSSRTLLAVPRRAEAGPHRIVFADLASGATAVVGQLAVRDWDRLWSPPESLQSANALLAEDTIRLVGYAVTRRGDEIILQLVWRSEVETERDWKVFVHLVAPDEAIAAQSDSVPGGGLRWTDSWRAGEYVRDEHVVAIPPGTGNGPMELRVGLYDATTGERATIRLAEDSGRDPRAWLDSAARAFVLPAPGEQAGAQSTVRP